MSEMEINGIALNKLALTPQNLAFADKLKRFRCAIVLDEPGCDQRSKAQIGIYNVLNTSEKPNVLIVTTDKLMYSWYQTLIGNLGADFKFVTSSKNGISFFSPDLSNLLIMDAKALASETKADVAEQIQSSGLVWDLLILDGGLSQSGFDSDYYSKNLHIKTKELIVFAPILQKNKDAASCLERLPAQFMENPPESFRLDETVTVFNPDTPAMKYEHENSEAFSHKITVANYSVSEEIVRAYEEQPKRNGGTSGGNILEELMLDKREIYVSPVYDKTMVEQLLSADPKLAAYIEKLEQALEQPDSTVVTYFSDNKTLEYIKKVLMVRLPDFERDVTVRMSGVYDTQSTMQRFGMAEESGLARVVLAKDGISERFLRVGKITHVFNYELPVSPLVLQQRYKRYGGNGFASPEFVVFADDKERFDSRMLNRVLALNFLDGFCYAVPSANVYLHYEGLDKALAAVIEELQSLADVPENERNEAFALNFSAKYRLSFTEFEQLSQYAESKLSALRCALGLSGSEEQSERAGKIADKLNQIRSGAVYFSGDGVLTASALAYGNDAFNQYKNNITGHEIVLQRAEAAALLQKRSDELENDGKFPYIADLVEKAPKSLRSAVLFNSYWFFCKERGAAISCREFIRDFNEGAM